MGRSTAEPEALDDLLSTVGLANHLSGLDDLTGHPRTVDQPATTTRPISPRTVEGWRYRGYGPPFVRIGHRIAYRRSAVARWVAQQERDHGTTHRKRRR